MTQKRRFNNERQISRKNQNKKKPLILLLPFTAKCHIIIFLILNRTEKENMKKHFKLGLLKEDDEKGLIPFYAEILISVLTASSQMEMKKRHYPSQAYFVNENQISMELLLKEFQEFWRENSEIWMERYQYKEAAPHLILQAFLQQVVITGGSISRELAGGRGRLDLCLHYGEGKYPIELKLRYGEKTYKEGLSQLSEYMDVLDCQEGWLVVFEQRKTLSWKKKIFWKTKRVNGKTIHIVGC